MLIIHEEKNDHFNLGRTKGYNENKNTGMVHLTPSYNSKPVEMI